VGVGQRRDQEISDRAIEPDRALIVDVEPQSLQHVDDVGPGHGLVEPFRLPDPAVEGVIRRIDQGDLQNSRHRPAELLLSSLGLAVVHRVGRVRATLGRAAAPPVRYSAPGAAWFKDASACYPFGTRPDFGVAAYANNHDEIGITCILECEMS